MTTRLCSANWRICASCAMASAPHRVMTSRRKSFSICRVRKGTKNDLIRCNARLAREADANGLPRPRVEDCGCRGVRRHVSERVAQHGPGTEGRICVQRGSVVRGRAVHKDLSLIDSNAVATKPVAQVRFVDLRHVVSRKTSGPRAITLTIGTASGAKGAPEIQRRSI